MPAKVYAVSSGHYSDYRVHAIYRRREDAEARCATNNATAHWLVDGAPCDDMNDLPQVEHENSWGASYMVLDTDRAKTNPEREADDDMRVEELDYYEGESLPTTLVDDARVPESELREGFGGVA